MLPFPKAIIVISALVERLELNEGDVKDKSIFMFAPDVSSREKSPTQAVTMC